MANCSKCKKSNNKCGCKDSAYTTVKTYTCPPDESCPVPAPCSEYVNTACVFYSNAGIVDLGIAQNTSLQEILQKLAILLGPNPECADPTNDCQATFNVYPVSVTSTTVTIAWSPSTTAVDYVLEYKQSSAISYTQLSSQTTTQAQVIGLTANTEYYFRVYSTCETGGCYSATINLTTLPS